MWPTCSERVELPTSDLMEFDDMEFTEASVVSVDSLRRYLCFTSTLASLRSFLRLAVAILEGLRGGRGTLLVVIAGPLFR